MAQRVFVFKAAVVLRLCSGETNGTLAFSGGGTMSNESVASLCSLTATLWLRLMRSALSVANATLAKPYLPSFDAHTIMSPLPAVRLV